MQIENTNIRLTKRKTITHNAFPTKTQRKTNKPWQKNKQQTTKTHTLYVITYKQKNRNTQNTSNYEQLAVQTENSNNATKRIAIRTTWMLFANCKYKHHINKKEKQRQSIVFQQSTQTTEHTYGNRTNNEKQTTTLYDIAHKQTQQQKIRDPTKTDKPKLRTNNCANCKFNQYYRNNNDTNDVDIVWKMKVQTSNLPKGKQRQTTFVQQKTQANTNIQKKTKDPTHKKLRLRTSNCAVQNGNSNNTTETD